MGPTPTNLEFLFQVRFCAWKRRKSVDLNVPLCVQRTFKKAFAGVKKIL